MTTVIFQPVPDSTSNWHPIVGDFTNTYLQDLNLDQAGKTRIVNESAQILANCENPVTPKYGEAGLVLGFVQSGKTLSFTTVTALARDNGYGLVILLAGVTNLLLDQSMSRLKKDLNVEKNRDWIVFDNPGAKQISHTHFDYINFKDRIDQWKAWRLGGKIKKPSLLVTVLKHTGRINNLANLLSSLDLSNVPVLIIDDESDQASPNTKSASNLKKGLDETSSTYEAIENLRNQCTRHTYLQYTATPQANLLAAKADALSPRFGRVITAGPDYIGGEEFFNANREHIREIPISDEITNSQLPPEPPSSFTESLASFWVACAIALAETDLDSGENPEIRSMMVQTSARTAPHKAFTDWTRRIKQSWSQWLRNPSSASYAEILNICEREFNELGKTYQHKKSFDEVKEWIAEAIDETIVVEVNSTEDAVKDIDWSTSTYWILVGGMKLDRGFTVRGITHTYMPRTVSENAATLQQRARFFGYHKKYFGLCRIYIARPTLEAFEAYVNHEKTLRLSLEKFQGKPLREWKRQFIMDRALKKPVRANVIGLKTHKSIISEGWIAPKYLHENADAIDKNSVSFNAFVNEIRKGAKSQNPAKWIDKRAGNKHELYTDISLDRVRDLIIEQQFTNSYDVNLSMPLSIAMARISAADPSATVDVVLMNSLYTGNLDGRTPSEKGIENIFVGMNPLNPKTQADINYVGDREIYTDKITLHLRLILVKGVVNQQGQMIPIPWFAVKPTKSLKIEILEEAE